MPKNRVLYLSYDGLTDPLGQSQILPYLIELAGKGFAITIISFEKQDAFRQQEQIIKDRCAKSGLDWRPLPYHKSPPVLSTLFDLWQLWSVVRAAQQANPFQIFHCRSYLTALIALKAKRKWKIKFIFDMRGFWADERVEGGLWKLSNPVFKWIYRFFKTKEKRFLAEADHVVSLTENARDEILKWDIPVAPITVIPTCVDIDFFDPKRIQPAEQIKIRKALGIEESDFVLLYLGSWGTWYQTSEMLAYFEMIYRQQPNARFLIVTKDSVPLDSFALRHGIIVTSASRDQVPLLISLASLAIAFILPSYSKKASSATKIGELLAMNIPVVTNRGWGDIERMADETSGVILAEKASAIRQESSDDYRSYCQRVMSLAIGVGRYEKIYTQLLIET